MMHRGYISSLVRIIWIFVFMIFERSILVDKQHE